MTTQQPEPDPESQQAGQASVRVLVADDQRLVRDGIVSLLRVQNGLIVVGEARDGQEAIDQAIALQPDVVLMDVRMPVMDGVESTREVLKHLPTCCVLMLTTFDDDIYVRDALRVGARGYLLKDMPVSDLAKAILAAAQGIYQLDPAVIEHIVAATGEPAAPGTAAQHGVASSSPHMIRNETTAGIILTRREREILRLVATGATNREVAERLIISEGTVKNHLARLFGRLGFRDRTQAVMYAREHGLL